MEVGIHIPDDIAAAIRKIDGQDIGRHILEAGCDNHWNENLR